MFWCVPLSNRELSWDQARVLYMGPVMRCQRMSHVCGAGEGGGCPPDTQEALPQEYWWWLARSPWDRGSSLKPPAATDQPESLSWPGQAPRSESHNIMRLHTERSFSLPPLSPLLLPRMTWNRKHTIRCAWSQAEGSKSGSDSKNVPWHSLEQSGYYASQCAFTSRWINDTPHYVLRGGFYFFDWRTKMVEWFFTVVLSEFKSWTCGHRAQRLCLWRGCSTVWSI